MAPVYRANPPKLGQFADAVYWKGQVRVLANPGMIERFGFNRFAGPGVNPTRLIRPFGKGQQKLGGASASQTRVWPIKMMGNAICHMDLVGVI